MKGLSGCHQPHSKLQIIPALAQEMTLMKADCHLGLSSLETASEMDIARKAPEVTLISKEGSVRQRDKIARSCSCN